MVTCVFPTVLDGSLRGPVKPPALAPDHISTLSWGSRTADVGTIGNPIGMLHEQG